MQRAAGNVRGDQDAAGECRPPAPRPQPHDRWLRAGGLRYRYRAAGEATVGTPLVLLHGLGVSLDYWARLLPPLAARRPVYALDLPGFGRTDDPPGVLDSLGLARAAHAWATALGLPRAHVLGHSQGAQIAAEYARTWPDAVASLALVAPTIGRRSPSLPWMLLRLLRDLPREDPTLLPVVIPAYLRAGIWNMLRTNLKVNNDDSVATVARLRLPLLLVRGGRDPIVDGWAITQLAAVAPHARRVDIGPAAHGPHWSHARALARIVNTFLDGLDEYGGAGECAAENVEEAVKHAGTKHAGTW